jgi:CdiI immunity protein
MPNYPELENLMSGWFHQDFDINGDTLEAVVGAYRAVTPPYLQRALASDIERFLHDAKDVEADFQVAFKPDIIPTGFAPTTREFLERIAVLVKQ